ncbi:MAG: hypothetical protein AB1714_21130 [Acidobacteriota bacterium]
MKRWTSLLPLLVLAASMPLSAATTVTMNPGDWLTVKPDGGVLSITSSTAKQVKIQCSAGIAEPTGPGDEEPAVNTNLTLKANQRAVAKTTTGVLVVKVNTATLVKIYCTWAPQTGHWSGKTSTSQPVSFDVVSGGTQWRTFKLKTGFRVGGCTGTIEITTFGPGTIANNKFGSTGSTYAFTGQFVSTTSARGTYKFTNFYLNPWCGYLTQNGTWTASTGSEAMEDEGEPAPSDSGTRTVIVIDGCSGGE